jgi:P-type Ca2+ transporter type 2A
MTSLEKLSPTSRGSAVNEQYEKWLERILTFEFSRDRRMMSVLVRRSDGRVSLLVKGAPESVLERSTSVLVRGQLVPLTPQLRQAISHQVASYAQRGLRTLALAYTDKPDANPAHYRSQSTADYARFERDLVFISVVGMLDPPRPEVKGAIAKCKSAGIRVICITGDNKDTAEAICRQIGIFGEDEDTTGKSYTGRELDALSPEEKLEAVKRASLFSRTEPGHKYQLVDLLQAQGLVVAMVRLFTLHPSSTPQIKLLTTSNRPVMV